MKYFDRDCPKRKIKKNDLNFDTKIVYGHFRLKILNEEKNAFSIFGNNNFTFQSKKF